MKESHYIRTYQRRGPGQGEGGGGGLDGPDIGGRLRARRLGQDGGEGQPGGLLSRCLDILWARQFMILNLYVLNIFFNKR